MLLEASRNADRAGENEVRTMLMAICGRYGHANVVELADAEPQAVIELWEQIEILDEGSYENIERRAKEATREVPSSTE